MEDVKTCKICGKQYSRLESVNKSPRCPECITAGRERRKARKAEKLREKQEYNERCNKIFDSLPDDLKDIYSRYISSGLIALFRDEYPRLAEIEKAGLPI